MPLRLRRLLVLPIVLALLVAGAVAGIATGKTSHEGWPKINGKLQMARGDHGSTMRGTSRSDELLGGHGGDTIHGNGGRDVLWGDSKPGGQPVSQHDLIDGGAGDDIIYASHGHSVIDGGTGGDIIHAHFGRGTIDCGSGTDTVYLSHRSRKVFKLRHCERISYKSDGG